MTILAKNLEILSKINPNLANKLKNTKQDKFEIYQGDDPADINYINTKNYKPIYKEKSIDEILSKTKQFEDYKNYPILYFFGFGNGIFYDILLENKKLKKIVIYEPEIEIIYLTLSLIEFGEKLKKIEFILPQTYTFVDAINLLENWDFRFFLKLYNLHIYSEYYYSYDDLILKVNKLNTEAIKQIIISHGNDATDSVIGIQHSLHNMPKMIKNYKFKDLIKNKISDTAIIVATGPSLTKQLPLLKQIAPFVTIISVDASLPILEKTGIKPDIVCVLERVELTSEFFINTSDKFMKDIYFVTASLVHQKTLNAIKGHKVITMRPFPYNRYFELQEFGYAGVGMSAANLAYEVAYLMKHKTTILIGQDLAYGDNVSHANGHVLGEDEVKPKESDLYITAYGGQGQVRTSKFWNIFKNTFQKDIAESKKNMLTINSTEGGARIEGALEIPFKKATKNLNTPKNNFNMKLPTKEEIEANHKHIIKKLKYAVEFGEEKKKEIEELFLKVAKVWDDLVFLNKTNQLEKIDFKELLEISNEIDKMKEIFNDTTFQELFFDVLQPFLVNAELELALVQVKPTRNEVEKQAKLIDWVMKHKGWLFSIAGSLDTQIHIMKEELQYIENYK